MDCTICNRGEMTIEVRRLPANVTSPQFDLLRFTQGSDVFGIIDINEAFAKKLREALDELYPPARRVNSDLELANA